MTDRATSERWDGTIDGDGPTSPTGAETVESRDTDGSVVFYDMEDPLAWVEAPSSMRLDSCTWLD